MFIAKSSDLYASVSMITVQTLSPTAVIKIWKPPNLKITYSQLTIYIMQRIDGMPESTYHEAE